MTADRAIIADASKVSPREFMDAIGFSSPELREKQRREMREDCKRAIRRGDTYGWPPVLVADCQREIDEEVTLTEPVQGDPMMRRVA